MFYLLLYINILNTQLMLAQKSFAVCQNHRMLTANALRYGTRRECLYIVTHCEGDFETPTSPRFSHLIYRHNRLRQAGIEPASLCVLP